jgi:NADPH:quinone reductase-like Zn-dependent oxidoreductase/thioesterase domain-containing protein/acyl carrier protein
MQLLQTLAATDGLGVESVWLVTRSTQPIENHADPLQVAQSPLWGLGRVAINEYPNLRCRLIDLATGSRDEIESLADELNTIDSAEDEIALHGELRYVRRLVPVSATSVHGIGRQTALESQPFRIELQRPGILDSLTACPIKRRPPGSNEVEVAVAAAGLNFKDLMLAMGLLPKAAITDDSVGRLLGLECSGRVIAVGDRVSEFAVGDDVVACGVHTMASHITVDRRFIAVKPRNLSFEQAAAFPIAFLTAWYSLHTLGQMRRGERVLIHLGTGGVGLAAVQLALRAGAIVFATAGSPEKRELLTALGVSHVMDSRTLTFADEVMESTNGEGVDIVLNSLAGEAIDKGLSILRPYGRFIEIGKVDIYKNRKVGLRPLSKSISVFAVDLTDMLQCRPEIIKSIAGELVAQFECGSLHPLPHRVFSVARVADAFRHMAEAKHVGKLVISMQDAEGLQFERGLRAVAVDPGAGYLITGGLGGFGLAVADHLAQRGARHLALVGRSGPSPAGQAALDSLRRGGVEVMVCQADIADRVQVQRVIADIERSMGPLRGVVHAAMVLDDAPIERLTEERMWKAMAPKLMGAWNLHTLTANAPLDFFVMFSSFASIVGNPGQANYVAGNAFLDALAYYRRARRLPALTVNWGVLGEVGHVATNPETLERLDRLGIKAMPLSETLAALDELMSSNAVQVGVAQLEWKALLRSTFSRIPARFGDLAGEGGAEEGRATASTYLRVILEADAATLPSLLETYIRDDVARAMGASPARIDTQQSLLSLGLDSLIAVEVRNRINDDLGVNVSLAKFMQSASISALAAYVAEQLLKGDRGEHSKTEAPPIAAVTEADIPSGGVEARVPKPLDQSSDQALLPHPAVQGMVGGIGRRDSGVASAGRRPSPCLVPIQPKGTKTPLFCVHPIGGAVHGYLALARRLGPDQPIHGLQDTGLNGESGPLDSIEDMARRYVEAIGAMQQTGPYLLAGWSMGGQIAFEMAQQFTQLGENVALLTLFDAFPAQAEHEIDLGLWLDEVRATSNPADQRELGEVEQAMRRHLRASARHKPSSYPGRVLLFLATEQDLLSRSRNVRFWRGPVAGGLELETVPASHFTIMQEPSIGPVARRLAAALDRAVRQTGQDVASAPSDALQPGNA